MRTFVIAVSIILVLLVLFLNKRRVALWTADPLGKCVVEDFRSEDADFYIEYSTYTHKTMPFTKSMLVLPPTGGKNIIDEGYALNLCRAGYKVYILEGWKNIKEYELDYSIHQIYQTRTQRAFNKIVELMEGDEIGVLGTSAGAINFTVTLGNPEVAKKVKAFFSIVAATPLCKVIATSHEKGLKYIRDLRFEKTDVKDMEEYKKNVCDVLKWESPKVLPDNIAHAAIVSTNDITVATKYQMQMVENYKPEILIKSNLDHFYTVVSSYFLHKGKIVSFFKKKL